MYFILLRAADDIMSFLPGAGTKPVPSIWPSTVREVEASPLTNETYDVFTTRVKKKKK